MVNWVTKSYFVMRPRDLLTTHRDEDTMYGLGYIMYRYVIGFAPQIVPTTSHVGVGGKSLAVGP